MIDIGKPLGTNVGVWLQTVCTAGDVACPCRALSVVRHFVHLLAVMKNASTETQWRLVWRFEGQMLPEAGSSEIVFFVHLVAPVLESASNYLMGDSITHVVVDFYMPRLIAVSGGDTWLPRARSVPLFKTLKYIEFPSTNVVQVARLQRILPVSVPAC